MIHAYSISGSNPSSRTPSVRGEGETVDDDVGSEVTTTVLPGKRKWGEKDHDHAMTTITLDKLADLDLDSDEEDEELVALSKEMEEDEDDVFGSDLRGSAGKIGRGRGRIGAPDWKRSPAKFRSYRDKLPSPVIVRERAVPVRKEAVEKIERASDPVEADENPDEKGDELTALPTPSEMCHMKWLRTVGFDEGGQIKCSVSNPGSEAGKTESLMADTIKNLTNVYVKKRAEIVTRDGVIPTPLHVVKKLALDHGETLHCEIARFEDGYHRVEIFSGCLRGMGEGITKRIAAHMACIDLLERIQLSGGTVKTPVVAFLPGWLTRNTIFRDLIALCKSKDLPPVKFVSAPNVTADASVDLKIAPYRAECWVGEDLVTVAESEAEIFAKREAAKQMYQLISSAEYGDTPYAIGQGCRSAAQLARSGHKQIMSDFKKIWLLQYRVENNQLVVPEEEAGFDDPIEVTELEKDIGNLAESESYKLMKQKTIKVTVNNKKKRMTVEESDEVAAGNAKRSISVQKTEDPDDW